MRTIVSSLAWVLLASGATAAPLHLEGDVSAGDGAYTLVTFAVPEGTAELQIAHSDGSSAVILDWGVWSPAGFRGWGGGLGDDAVIGEATSSRGYLPGAIPAGDWTLVIGEAQLAGGTGHYIVDVTSRTAPTLTPIPRAAFVPRVLETGARWYRGDFHVHSDESGDARGTLPEIITLAQSRHLDFVVLSDHNTISQHGRQAAAQETLDDLLLVRGAEVTTYGGHGNAVGSSAYVDHRVGLGGVSARTMLDAVAAQGALFIVNHPTINISCIGCEWKLADTPWDEVAGIEIHNGNFETSYALFTATAIAFWDARLAEGHRLAAIGGSDDHDAGEGTGITSSPLGSPTTLVWADELSEAGILAGVRAGRTQVLLRGPDDPHIELSVGEARLGDTASGLSTIALAAEVVGTVPAGTHLVIYRDGVRAGDKAIDAPGASSFSFAARGGLERFRAELELGGKRFVVTSHLYVDGVAATPDAGVAIPDAAASLPDARAIPPASDGGGCRIATRPGPPALPLVALFFLAGVLARRRR